ncbi:MAG: alpha/beta hydrolase [Clostridia bacterium]|nr:alpha/beta hydrolase [Clostridia bacterium]
MKIYPDAHYTDPWLPGREIDLFVPEGRCRHTVMWMHGGGLEAGSRKGFDGIAAQLCAEGIGFASVEYRMYPDAKFPDFLVDCAQAAAWLKANAKRYGLSDRIVIGGSSAGAYISMMLCFARQYLNDAGLQPEDFDGYIFDAAQPTTHYNVLKYRGMDPRLCRVDEAAPLYYVDSARPGRPLSIIYAENDIPARPQQNDLLVATLRHFEYDMSLVSVTNMPGYGHCGYDEAKKDGRFILADMIAEFVDRLDR